MSEKLSITALVDQTRHVLQRSTLGDYGLLLPTSAIPLGVDVSPSTLERALRIMETILVRVTEEGFELRLPREGGRVRVCVAGEEFALHVREKRNQLSRTPGDPKKWPQVEYRPAGLLRLKVAHEWGWREEWGDDKRTRLEGKLDKVVPTLLEGARWVQAVRENERKARESGERESEVRQKVRDLENQVVAWEQARRVHAYLAAVEEAAIRRTGIIEPGGPLAEWLSWAKRYADSLDPLKGPE